MPKDSKAFTLLGLASKIFIVGTLRVPCSHDARHTPGAGQVRRTDVLSNCNNCGGRKSASARRDNPELRRLSALPRGGTGLGIGALAVGSEDGRSIRRMNFGCQGQTGVGRTCREHTTTADGREPGVPGTPHPFPAPNRGSLMAMPQPRIPLTPTASQE